MPLYEYLCLECGGLSEVLVTRSTDQPKCRACESTNLKRMLSTTSSLSGVTGHRMPGAGDTACCGSTPASAGCAGPGSCCGKAAN